MKNDAYITEARLKELLSYDPSTGLFTWIARTSNRVSAGDIAGKPNDQGYWVICIDGTKHRAHRLAFLFMTGKFPEGDGEHENGNPSDNSWDNLRPASRSQNIANTKLRVDNKHGLKGVHFANNRKRFVAKIMVDGKSKHLGDFITKELAAAAYAKAANENFGQFARTA